MKPLHQLRAAAAELVEGRLDQDVLPAHDRVGGALGQAAAQPVGEPVLGRQRDDVGGRALQHRHVRGLLGHRRHQRHRGGAAADHDDALAGVVEVLGPVLRVDDRAGEAVDPLELGRVALVVAVVAAAGPEEVAGQPHASRPLSVRSASTVQRASALDHSARDDAVVEADLLRRCRSRARSRARTRGSRGRR